jgi:hypothetical protein
MPEIVLGFVQAFDFSPEQFPAQFWVLNFLMPEAGCFNNQVQFLSLIFFMLEAGCLNNFRHNLVSAGSRMISGTISIYAWYSICILFWSHLACR